MDPTYPWGWKTRPWNFQDDAVRIWDPTAPLPGSWFVDGEPIWWPTQLDSWDMAFELTTGTLIGILTLEDSGLVADH